MICIDEFKSPYKSANDFPAVVLVILEEAGKDMMSQCEDRKRVEVGGFFYHGTSL